MKLKAYDIETKEIVCWVARDSSASPVYYLISDRTLGPGEENFHARQCYVLGTYAPVWGRVEAATDRTLKVPDIPSELTKKLSWLPIQKVKIAMTTYSKTLAMPDEWEIDDLVERGHIFLGAATDDGKSDGGTCILVEDKS